ncbi:molecular chaperone DnaJ [Neoasaia chiangmaiensis NBRC 101099]|uniref:Molecular chaperone DnaJ n=1 Tax=Neoasaia chiangmaiensis TaxID=320497 RepID=A0A1U9KNX9_9PROT|nr:DnaJ C-terminal domain-containing protein [Neoasaia chiangmaiensis]AQS87453.1 molecular chaperone DnaJ [Neoasaia chiangmaiensis]GBR42662.1 molecular chaperone DnaJ [Neoasaia chiangmaiensis NBRC 101099]GEN16235.1 molecular chaperone DnaJ [Neoasaia chiangmaiensis]
MSDPYAALGLARGASDKEIRSAYRKLAKQYHPDHNPNNKSAEEKFKAVSSAYNLLGDKEKRARFDRGEIDAEGNERGPFGPGGGFRGGPGGFGGHGGAEFSQEDLGAFFSDMFGGGGFSGDFHPGGTAGRRRPARGADRSYSLTVSFEDSVLGTTTRVTLPEAGSVEVRIPAGIEDGQSLRLAGKGAPGRQSASGEAGPAGDALITIQVSPSSMYTREGRNLRATVPVGFRTAILGGKLTVPTPKGPVTMKVPRHSDSGTVLRLGGRGVAEHGQHKAGDLYVTLRVEIGKVDPALEEFLAKQHADATAQEA